MAMGSAASDVSSKLNAVRQDILPALRTCGSEADIVQVLYRGLHGLLGYQVILLQVLEREGWWHAMTVDQGVLQDIRRKRLAESASAPLYGVGRTAVLHPHEIQLPQSSLESSRGPGS